MESTGTSSCNFSNDGVKLLDAAAEGLADDAVELLKKHPDLIHIANSKGDTALHVAVRSGRRHNALEMIGFLKRGHLKILKAVLREGNADGDTPFDLAIKNDYEDIADIMAVCLVYPGKKKPALPQLMNPMTIKEKKKSMIQPMQLKSTADIQMRAQSERFNYFHKIQNDAEEKWTKLFKADEEDFVTLILEHDPTILESMDPSGRTALHAAASLGNMGLLKKVIDFIEKNYDLNWLLLEVDRHGRTPLHHAIIHSHEKVARYLVGVTPRAIYKIDQEEMSPLCLAICKDYLNLVRYMIRSNLSRSIREEILKHVKKVSIAQSILEVRDLGALQAIVEGLPDVIYSLDKRGWRPLSYAASKGYFHGFNYILKNFPDCARISDMDGSFPVHKAAAGGQVSIVRKFLSCCPQALNDIDAKGQNPFEVATYYKKEDVVSYLETISREDKLS